MALYLLTGVGISRTLRKGFAMNGKNFSFLFLWLVVFLLVGVLNYFVKQKAIQDIRELRKVLGTSVQIRFEHGGR